mgnify:CR=1 FL=1
MRKKSRQSTLAVLLLILIGANMRTALTSSTPVLGNIAHSFSLPNWFLGSITTIPLLCFAVVSPFVNKLRQKLGLVPLLAGTFIILTIGSFIRIYSFSSLLAGMLLVGASIAVLNVLAPTVVATFFPNKLGQMTGAYSLPMTIFSALSAGMASPLASAIGWQATFQWISLFSIIGLIVALFNRKPKKTTTSTPASVSETGISKPEEKREKQSVWKRPLAWYLTGFMGFQSMLFYSILTWLPSIFVSKGFSANQASLLLGLLQLASLPMAYLTPSLAQRRNKQAPIIVLILAFFVISFILLLVGGHSLTIAIITCIILGFGTTSSFSFSMFLFSLKTDTPDQTTAVSGMAQSMGYIIAAIGPLLAGIMHDQIQTWSPVILVGLLISVILAIFGFLVDKKDRVFPKPD